jgi:hypothetical protein
VREGLSGSSGRRYPVEPMRRSFGVLVLASLLAGLLPPATPASAERGEPKLPTPALLERDVARGRLDRAEADLYLAYAFGAPGKLPAAYRSDAPWDGTLPLLRLEERVAEMPRGSRRAAIRETLSSSSALANCSSAAGGASTHSSTYFYIEYGTIGGGLTISQYAASLDTSWATEVNTFGWSAPPLHPSVPGGKYHVVVAALAGGLYGFVSTSGTYAGLAGDNPNTPWTEPDAYRSCMALNNDYSGFPGTPQQALDATTAHEFNHSLQFGYGAITGANAPDASFTEGGATWMEDEVFDASNDNYNYLWPDFTDDMGSYSGGNFPYPYWVVFRALTERFGTGAAGAGEQVMEDFWELTSQSATSNMLPALNTALVSKGTNLADAYHAAAIALKFNRACGGGYVYPYCLEEGPAYVAHPGNGPTAVQGTVSSVPGSFLGSVPDNYALNWVTLPTSGGSYDVTLQNTSLGGQLRGTVVCDTGSALARFSLPAVVGAGASTNLAGFNPSGCLSVVAVITNQFQTADNPTSSVARSDTLQTGAPTGATLAVDRSGNGMGTVNSPAGIDCGADCTETFPVDTDVTLTASAGANSVFTGWSGDCSGTSSTCMLTMDSAKTVTATFDLIQRSLAVTKSGTGMGTVTSSPAGINCGVDCSEAYPHGTAVTLTASAGANSVFTGWSGDCSGTSSTCMLSMDSAKTVTARFDPTASPSPAPQPKQVALRAKPKKVEKGGRTRLTAVVSPCTGHQGHSIDLYRGSAKIATKASDGACTAIYRVRIRKAARFTAISPQQDADHLAGTSNSVKVRVRRPR